MKCIFNSVAVFFLFLPNSFSFGQKLDSITYANGYLYYLEYGKGKPIVVLGLKRSNDHLMKMIDGMLDK
jgi:hypothetical protein